MSGSIARKEAVEVFALSLLLGMSVLFTGVLLVAAGTYPPGKAVIDMTIYDEQTVELIFVLLVVWPIVSVGVYRWGSE